MSASIDTPYSGSYGSNASGRPSPVDRAPLIGAGVGFAGQLKELRESICRLESQVKEKNDKISRLTDRIKELEINNEVRNARRREAVSSFNNLRTMNLEASTAFTLRARNLQPEDLESMLIAWGTQMNTVINHHQRALRVASRDGPNSGVQPVFAMSNGGQTQHALVYPPHYGPVGFAYPKHYNRDGWCIGHKNAYPCRFCGS